VQEEERGWANLPPDLVRKISGDLLSADVTEYIRLRAVCKPWRNSTADPSLLDPKFFPRKWLLIAEHKLRNDGEPERFVNVDTGAVLEIYLPTPMKYTHHGNAEGLLVLHDAITDRVRLLNPLTMAFTDLPSMWSVRMAAQRYGVVGAYDRFCKHNIKAAGVIVDVDGEAANPVPTVVLSLKAGTYASIVCAQPGDIFWIPVDISCADEIEGELPAIQGGLSVQGRFFVPSRTGDLLAVELRPQPRLMFVARQAGDEANCNMNERSYLVPSGNDVGAGMLLIRTWGRGNAHYETFTVDLCSSTLTMEKLCGTDTTVFLPSVTLRSSAFPRVCPNVAYGEEYMRMLMSGDFI
jgi:hypothetical protein